MDTGRYLVGVWLTELLTKSLLDLFQNGIWFYTLVITHYVAIQNTYFWVHILIIRLT